jgi:hypothetical protein
MYGFQTGCGLAISRSTSPSCLTRIPTIRSTFFSASASRNFRAPGIDVLQPHAVCIPRGCTSDANAIFQPHVAFTSDANAIFHLDVAFTSDANAIFHLYVAFTSDANA